MNEIQSEQKSAQQLSQEITPKTTKRRFVPPQILIERELTSLAQRYTPLGGSQGP